MRAGAMSDEGEAEAFASAGVGLAAWVGAIVARLRAGVEPYPGASRPHPRVAYHEDAGERATERCEERTDAHAPDPDDDAESFGVRSVRKYQKPPVPLPSELGSLLDELSGRARGEAWEDAVWTAVIWYCPWIVPERIALDLVTRRLPKCRYRLAHDLCPEPALFVLAENWPEAVHQLAVNRYIDPDWSWDDVLAILNDWKGLELLGVLAMAAPSSQDKAIALIERIEAQNQRSESPVFKAVGDWCDPTFRTLWQERRED